jgi:5-methylcytosine-specific restriction endonuclease McrA
MGKPRIPKSVKQRVFYADRFRCIACGARNNLTVDHLIPRSKGGTNDITNLVTRCEPCNRAKGDEWPSRDEWEYVRS